MAHAEVILVRGGREVALGRLRPSDCELDLVDRLARIRLAARRRGGSIVLRHPSTDLIELLHLAGLADLLVDRPPGSAPPAGTSAARRAMIPGRPARHRTRDQPPPPEGPPMTIRHTVPNGAPCWVDLMSSDTSSSRTFYAELFGWTSDEPDPEFGGYANFSKDGEMVAGLMASQPGMGPADVWSVYLAVGDAAATVAAARDNGGQVLVEPMPVADLGVMAVVADAGGAAVGMWQPGQHRGGLVATSGAPCHFELRARDYDASVAFYERVFGWRPEPVSDSPELRYTVLNVGDGQNAGIMDAGGLLPEGVPPHWVVYFAVDDVEKALATVADQGGTTVQPAEDTPYGRIATAADVNGATFNLRADC